jgi:HlyD family secretion protein
VAQHESVEAHEQASASAIRTAEAQRRVQEAALQTARDQVEQKQAALAQAQINLEPPGPGAPTAGLVWVSGRDGRPVPIQVALGMTDGTWTEVIGGDLTEGQAVLIGVESAPAAPPTGGPGLRL